MDSKVYLGDGVYVDLTEWDEILLTTENGITATNSIVMDGSVLSNFEMYVGNLRGKKDA